MLGFEKYKENLKILETLAEMGLSGIAVFHVQKDISHHSSQQLTRMFSLGPSTLRTYLVKKGF